MWAWSPQEQKSIRGWSRDGRKQGASWRVQTWQGKPHTHHTAISGHREMLRSFFYHCNANPLKVLSERKLHFDMHFFKRSLWIFLKKVWRARLGVGRLPEPKRHWEQTKKERQWRGQGTNIGNSEDAKLEVKLIRAGVTADGKDKDSHEARASGWRLLIDSGASKCMSMVEKAFQRNGAKILLSLKSKTDFPAWDFWAIRRGDLL